MTNTILNTTATTSSLTMNGAQLIDDKQAFLDASNAVYSRSVPSDLKLLTTPSGTPLVMTNDADGFYAEAFDYNRNIIISFEGTSSDNGAEYKKGSFAADELIKNDHIPASFLYAQDFYNEIRRFYPYPTNSIYVTGHSLGGAEAEYVAEQNPGVAGGITFGAPGLPGYEGLFPNANVSNVYNYIDYGDPIGNYAGDAYSAYSAYSLTGYHYGNVLLVGSIGDKLSPIIAAWDVYHEDVPLHALTNYASDLGLKLDTIPDTSSTQSKKVMFEGTDANGQYGLWVSDGTAAGTNELKSFGAYGNANPPSNFVPFGGEVLFTAGGGLWVSDGTAAGTNELKSFGAYGNANPPSNFVPFGGEVLFTAGGRIWVSDGTVAGTSEIINLLPLDTSNLTVFGNLVLFCAGGNIWSTDGTFPGTHQLTGLSGTSNQSFSVMQGFTIFNKMALFSGIDANNDYGIWVTDGTALGTKEIATFGGIIWVPPPRNFIAINNKVFLTQGTGLFITDGTSAGTYNLNNSAFGLYSSGALVAFNNEVVFTGIDMTGAEGLWITDGTDAGTHEFFRESGFFFRVGDIVCFDNKILFNDGKGSLSISDGTAAGTHALIGIVGAASNGLSLGPSDMTVFNNEVLFNGYNASRKQGLWVTDGTAAGTHELSGISGANASLNPQHISVIAPAFSIAYFLTKQATLDKIAGGFAISDTAQHIEHDLWALLADASYINSITASGLVGVSAATFVADRAVLDKISGGFGIVDTAADIKTYLDFLSDPSIVAVTISDNAAVGANVAQLTSDATTIVELRNADGTPFHLAISDTAANIQNGIGALVANTSHIGSITASGGPASFSTAVFAADQPTLNKIVGGFGIKDTAAKVSGSLDALQGDVADIASIKFSDASPPTLNISSAQLSADAAALAKIASPYILDVANASGSSSYIGYGNGLVFNIGGGTTSTIKGGGLNESFVFAAGFKAATISEFATHNGVAANDTISLAKSDFADWATLLSDAHTGAGGSISFVSQTSGATLTLAGVSVSAFEKVGAPYHSEFTFHA